LISGFFDKRIKKPLRDPRQCTGKAAFSLNGYRTTISLKNGMEFLPRYLVQTGTLSYNHTRDEPQSNIRGTGGIELKKNLLFWIFGFFTLFGVFIIFHASGPCEEGFEIYIRNQPYSGEVIKKDGEFCIPLEEFARAARMPFMKKGDVYFLLCREDQAAPEGMGEGLLVNGKPFEKPLINRNGALFVPLKDMAAAVGAGYYINRDTRIIDVVFVNTTISREPSPGGSQAGSQRTLLYYYFDG
jgi:hypothetical protein